MATNELPASVPAEQALLGLMIHYPNAVTEAGEQGLRPEDFFDASHRRIYQAISELNREKKIADLSTLAGRLSDKGDLERIGGSSYLMTLYDLGDSEAKAIQYISTIQKKALLRRLMDEAKKIEEMCRDRSYAEDEVLDEARSSIVRIADSRRGSEFILSSVLAPKVVDYISSLKTTKKNIGVRTGLYKLDRNTGGFQPGDLVILAARTSVGKTMFAANIATYAAVHERKSVAIFTLEMPANQIITRMLAIDGEIPSEELKTGDLTPEHANALMESCSRLANAGVAIDDSSTIKVGEILSKCKKLRSDLEGKGKSLDLIVIDYLQLVTASKDRDNRQQDVSEISRGLKELARTIECPVIALSQLSRESTKRQGAPSLTDLRESGAIEQDADMVIFLHNTDENVEEKIDRNVKLTVAKNRNGSLMNMDMKFNTTCGIFKEVTDMYEEA
ncbi:MAG: replicative DNA helicase [Erysipelotrichales bacterium]|nr:replicative DNA helicase [Erysipelotrichales bacterium]